jgi:hypothetical protein
VIIELGVCQDQSRQINDLPGGRGYGEGQVHHLLVDGELVAESKVLQGDLPVATTEHREESKQVEQESDHLSRDLLRISADINHLATDGVLA